MQKSQSENKQRWDLNLGITILDPQTTGLPHPGGNGNETQVPEGPGAQSAWSGSQDGALSGLQRGSITLG